MAHLGIKVWCDVDVDSSPWREEENSVDNGRSSFSFQLGVAGPALEVDTTALANDSVSLRSCDVRFKDGTELSIPKDPCWSS